MNSPKIMNMDWRALGYWPVYKEGKIKWEKEEREIQTNDSAQL